MGATQEKQGVVDYEGQCEVVVDYIYRCRNYFNLVREIPDFTLVRRGKVIGLDAKKKVRAPYTGVILLVKEAMKSGEEAFVMGREI